MKPKAVVLLSGGLDSTTTLAIANQQYDIYAMSFDYGQKQKAELNAAKRIAEIFKVKHHKIFNLDLGQFGGSALTDKNIEVPDYSGSEEIPVTYVPARNTMFFSIAMGWAEVLGASAIFTGATSIDYSHYCDCRPEYFEAFNQLAKLATKIGVEGQPILLHAPLLYLSKAEIISTGIKLGVDYSLTVSCYRANDQGQACGNCDSCTFRKKGFREAKIEDPTHYQKKEFENGCAIA